MPVIIHRDVQESTKWNLRVFLRELNVRLRDTATAINTTRMGSVGSVSFTTAANASHRIWVPNEDFTLASISIVSTTAAGTVTPNINGVAVGGAPFAFTAAGVNHPITSANQAVALDVIGLTTAGLTGTATMTLNLERIN